MTVENLIEELKKMPPSAEVWHLWDGKARTCINIVYESKGGNVITADYTQLCYDTIDRPIDAPTEQIEPYWHTPDDPNEE